MKRLGWCAVGLFAVLIVASAASAADWPTWGGNAARSGQATTSLVRAANASTLRKRWSRNVGAPVDAQPLYAAHVSIHGATHSAYFVATEAGRVLAYDAKRGTLLWHADVGATTTGCAQLPGGIFGITGTPVYDHQRQALYLSSRNQLWALDARTGSTLPGWPIVLPGMDEYHEHVWGALAQRGTTIYAATASYCDRSPFKGRLYAVDIESRAVTHEWDPVPGSDDSGGGSIWGWGGVAIDPATGDVWAATGNAIVGPSITDEAADDAEALVELTPDLNKIQSDHPGLIPGHGDYDFGATPLLFQPTGCTPLVAALNKVGELYIWQRSNIAKGPTQRLKLAFPATLFGVPAWDPATHTLFMTTTLGAPGVSPGLLALHEKACRFALRWRKRLGAALSSAPTISGDIVAVDTGLGQAEIFRTLDGKRLASFPLGHPSFVAPVLIGRDLAVTGWTRQLTIYRLPPTKLGKR